MFEEMPCDKSRHSYLYQLEKNWYRCITNADINSSVELSVNGFREVVFNISASRAQHYLFFGKAVAAKCEQRYVPQTFNSRLVSQHKNMELL